MSLFFDNIIFNVNGYKKERLGKALELICEYSKIAGYKVHKDFGLILYWMKPQSESKDGFLEFPCPLNVSSIIDIIYAWLQDPSTHNKYAMDGFDVNADHDGDISKGWRIYVEEWGHIDGSNCSLCAIMPTYVWHGK